MIDHDRMTGLYQRIGQALVDAAPQGWKSVSALYLTADAVDTFEAIATLRDGSRARMTDVDRDFGDALLQLRQAMYAPGKGAWFSANVTVLADGRFSIDFDYDSQPAWPFEVDDSAYAGDLDVFPRDEQHTPSWLREIVDRTPSVARD